MSTEVNTAKLTATVAYRATWGAPWTDDATIDAERASFSLAPVLPRATLSREYGYVITGGVGGEVRARYGLQGYYIRIAISDGTSTHYWYGVVVEQHHEPQTVYDATHPVEAARGQACGRQRWECCGLEYFLAKTQIRQTVMEANSNWSAGGVNVVAPFNQAARAGRLTGNRGAARDLDRGCYLFSDDASTSALWTAQDAMEYLVSLWHDTETFTYYWSPDSLTAGLSQSEVLDFTGQTYYDALNQLAPAGRGWSWRVICPDGETPQIEVLSIVAEDVLQGAQLILMGSGKTVEMDLDALATVRPSATIDGVQDSFYHRIEVLGGRLRVVFSLGAAGSSYHTYANAVAGWDAADETAYEALTDEGDAAQAAYDRVYQSLVLEPDWDGLAGAATVLRTIDPATGTMTANKVAQYCRRAMRFDRTMPNAAGDEEIAPLVIAKHPVSGQWFRMDRPYPEDALACSVRTLDDDLGIQWRSTMPHYYGYGDYAGVLDGDVISWKSVIATVAMQTCERVRCIIDASLPDEGESRRTKTIAVPQLGYTYMVPGTVTDFDGAALTTSAGQVIRDDSAELLALARLAAQWYGRLRQIVRLDYHEGIIRDVCGYVLSKLTYDGLEHQPDTVISLVEYVFGAQQTTRLETAWSDVDLAAVAARAPSRSAGDLEHYAAADERAGGGPVLAPVSAASGGGSLPARIASGGPGDTYTGDIYGAGPAAAATVIGATIKICQIDAGQTVPANTWLLVTQINGTYYGQVPVWL
jgi:hypothetical protein